MKPWYVTAVGATTMAYLAWHGVYESAGWWVAAFLMSMFSVMAWLIEAQQRTMEGQHASIQALLQMAQERDVLDDAKVASIADMAGVGPSWRAQWAIATARVQAKREKGAKHD